MHQHKYYSMNGMMGSTYSILKLLTLNLLKLTLYIVRIGKFKPLNVVIINTSSLLDLNLFWPKYLQEYKNLPDIPTLYSTFQQ